MPASAWPAWPPMSSLLSGSAIQAHWREGSPNGAEGACWRARADRLGLDGTARQQAG
ncbi:hypothetical protein ACFOEY_11420 [Paracandidimonas soli]|uniref:hypothetical protein n=1 Tax=Paracandidimonas soli TaxID=1917182 RepID=UPI0036095FEF